MDTVRRLTREGEHPTGRRAVSRCRILQMSGFCKPTTRYKPGLNQYDQGLSKPLIAGGGRRAVSGFEVLTAEAGPQD
jgi:hypothetical protein